MEGWKVVPGDFDPELHLRLTGERALLDQSRTQGRDPWDTPFLEIAAALVAVGAMPRERAQDIVDDYELASGLRGRGGRWGFRRLGRSLGGTRQPLKAPRVVVCEQSFEEPWGKLDVHYASLGDRGTTVCITASSSGGIPPMLPTGPGGSIQQPTLTDDRGHTESAHFSGGGGAEGGFRGRLTTMHPLAQDTKWLDVGPRRVNLVGESDPPYVEVETLPDVDPAERYLWTRMSAGRHGPHHLGIGPVSIDAAIETLVAVGALDRDNPVIDEVLSVLAAFSGQQPSAIVPEPWAALLAGVARQGGRSGIIALGVVTPPFDDMVASLEALMVADGNFEVHVVVSPDSAGPRGAMPYSVTGPRVEWWAADDMGNSYLGAIGSWGGGGDIGEGAVTYWPALDPRATQLRITPTGSHERAVITVEIPEFEERT